MCLLKVQEKTESPQNGSLLMCQSVAIFPCQIDQVAAVGLPLVSKVKTSVPLRKKPAASEFVNPPDETVGSLLPS